MPYFGLLSFLPPIPIILQMFTQGVSMPYFGLLSFLHIRTGKLHDKFICFNALLRASFFSTLLLKKIFINIVMCFNALLRASFFSTRDLITLVPLQMDVFQCPTSGFFLFYTAAKLLKDDSTGICFNALLRASFFSTLCLCTH